MSSTQVPSDLAPGVQNSSVKSDTLYEYYLAHAVLRLMLIVVVPLCCPIDSNRGEWARI